MRQSIEIPTSLPFSQRYCRKVCQESDSNFVKTFRFLPKHRRLGFEAFYAFCRLVDDAVDEAPSPEVAATELELWAREVDAIYQGDPQTPVGRALAPVIKRFDIPRQYVDDLVDGCRMDLTKHKYESFEELKEYCYRVASCVGLVCLHLFEADLSEKTQAAAISLGYAVQLTNILRDVAADLQQDRLYLPMEDLRQYQLKPEDLHRVNGSRDQLISLIEFEIGRARDFYQKAWSGFPTTKKTKSATLDRPHDG